MARTNIKELLLNRLKTIHDFDLIEVFQFFYAADNLECEEWDVRSLANEDNPLEKDRIALLAMELAIILLKNK